MRKIAEKDYFCFIFEETNENPLRGGKTYLVCGYIRETLNWAKNISFICEMTIIF